jgi:hypothetical protein
MTSETLILDDLPHLAEEVRKTGYRSAMNEKEGTIKLDDEDVQTVPKQKMITSWELIRVLWKGRTWVICTSMSPRLFMSDKQISYTRRFPICVVCFSLSLFVN